MSTWRGRKVNDTGISRRKQPVPGSAVLGVLCGSRGCRGVPPAALGMALQGGAGEAGRVPGCTQQRCEIRQLEALAAAQHPAVWLESCHCLFGDADVLWMKHLCCAGACSETAESEAVTVTRAQAGTAPGHCAYSLCPGEFIWLWGGSCAHHRHPSGGACFLHAVLCIQGDTWLSVLSVLIM